MPAPYPRGLRDPPQSPPTRAEVGGPAPPCPPSWGPPPPRALPGWGRGGFKTPRRPSRSPPPPPPFAPRAVPPPPPAADPPDSEAPGWGQGGRPLRGTPPRLRATRRAGLGRERRKEPPKSSPRPQSLRRAAAAPAAAAATAGRRGRRSGRRDELVGRRGKKVLRLFRCRWEPEARGPLGAAQPGEEAGLGDPRPPLYLLGRLLPPCLHVVPQAPPLRTSPQEPQTRLPRRPDPKTSGAPPCTPHIPASLLSLYASKNPSPPGSGRLDLS